MNIPQLFAIMSHATELYSVGADNHGNPALEIHSKSNDPRWIAAELARAGFDPSPNEPMEWRKRDPRRDAYYVVRIVIRA